jgi:hypothetical protein
MDVNDGPHRHSSDADADADAQVDQGEADTDAALPDARWHYCSDQGVEAGPEDATRSAQQAQGQCSRQRCEGEREQTLPSIWAAMPARDDASGDEPVDEGAGRPDDGHRQPSNRVWERFWAVGQVAGRTVLAVAVSLGVSATCAIAPHPLVGRAADI